MEDSPRHLNGETWNGEDMMFSITDNRGFQVTYANGWTVSVQFGHGSYCANRDYNQPFEHEEAQESVNAEIAAWDKNGIWHKFDDEGDTVDGWKTPDEVLEFMNMIAAKE